MINFGAPSPSMTEMVTNTKKDGRPGAKIPAERRK